MRELARTLSAMTTLHHKAGSVLTANGNAYNADAFGMIYNVAAADIEPLLMQGCTYPPAAAVGDFTGPQARAVVDLPGGGFAVTDQNAIVRQPGAAGIVGLQDAVTVIPAAPTAGGGIPAATAVFAITSVTASLVSGVSATSGATVTVYGTGEATAPTATAASNGTWSVMLSPALSAAATLTATQTVAGVTSGASAPYAYAPAAAPVKFSPFVAGLGLAFAGAF